MENSINRNKVNARRIESWLLNRIALKGGNNVAKEIGVDKAQITRWKESWLPKMAMLLAVLEWGVVDDDIARVSKQVALYLEENILTNVRKKKSPAGTEDSEQYTMNF
ncbi:CII family protein [Klebsiella oxytoca]|uniref:CII family transcriptional regulator n=1 Tax=Klebsiella oxytoca TaxID=571 RepID=UPI0007CC45C0|nr:CII family transcriptional regulator [Klebsiella oxytoca]SAQ31466.1 CII family protein [Klebsiella oxytoca]SAQ65396.1 CII family protein [Klebsiella oxytoca]SBL28908.1 CII family protein [Klebsiella oxytoca]